VPGRRCRVPEVGGVTQKVHPEKTPHHGRSPSSEILGRHFARSPAASEELKIACDQNKNGNESEIEEAGDEIQRRMGSELPPFIGRENSGCSFNSEKSLFD